MNKKILICVLSLFCFFLFSGTIIAAKLIKSDNPDIRYSGRIDFSNPELPKFDWPGISIFMKFKSKSIKILLEDGGGDYNVFIDGMPKTVWRTERGKDSYSVEGLSDTDHSILVTKRNEGFNGIGVFKGFELDDDAQLLPLPPPKDRRIEITGDSFTCGYGNEGADLKCESLRPYQNHYMTYGAILCRLLKADMHCEAISGKGMVRNYGYSEKVSPDPMPTFFDRTLQNDTASVWDYSKWKADLVIIFLGLNDFSTAPNAEEETYVKAYKEFVEKLWKYYPDAKILCLSIKSSPLINKYLSRIISEEESAHKDKIFKFELDSVPFEELGCDWHPKVSAHKKFADQLLPYIKQIMDWQ